MSMSMALACYRELGAELRKRREAAGLTEAQLSEEIGWTHTRISRMELGQIRPSEVDMILYLAFCGIYGNYGADVLEIRREAEPIRGYWLRSHDLGLPESVSSLIYHESMASMSTSYEPAFVPGLLQTEGYIRALTIKRSPTSDIDLVVRTRKDRQQILHRPRPGQFRFYLHEDALRLMVGGPAIMHDQLLTLLLQDGLRHVAIRVVPAAEAQAFGGAFRLFEYIAHQPMVYLDGLFCGLFLDDTEYVDAYRRLIPAIADVALNEQQSREYLAALASDYDREEADPDVRDHMEEKQL